MKKLNNFDSLYNKIIYEWSEGNTLGDILNNIKNYQITQKPQEEITYTTQFNDIDNSNRNQYIKKTFNQNFPKYIIKKCQVKFPIEDNIKIPENIIDNFWEKYSDKIIDKLADITIEKVSDCFYNILLDIFGKDDEYNEELCNSTAIQLVNLND